MDLFDRPVFPVLNKNFRLEDAVTERSRSHDFGANGELAIGSSNFHDLFVIQPNRDVGSIDPYPEVMPLTVLEIAVLGGFVFAGVIAIDTADTNQSTTPSTADEGAILFADGKGNTCKKVRSFGSLCGPLNFIVLRRKIFAQSGNAC